MEAPSAQRETPHHPCQPWPLPVCCQNQQIHKGYHINCPSLSPHTPGESEQLHQKALCWLHLSIQHNFRPWSWFENLTLLGTWVQHSATGYWTSSQVEPRESHLLHGRTSSVPICQAFTHQFFVRRSSFSPGHHPIRRSLTKIHLGILTLSSNKVATKTLPPGSLYLLIFFPASVCFILKRPESPASALVPTLKPSTHQHALNEPNYLHLWALPATRAANIQPPSPPPPAPPDPHRFWVMMTMLQEYVAE